MAGFDPQHPDTGTSPGTPPRSSSCPTTGNCATPQAIRWPEAGAMHQTGIVAYVVPRWLARFCEWRGYWKVTHTDNQSRKSPNRDSATDDKTRERMRQAQRHVEYLTAGRQCPVCGQSKWQTDPAHRLREFTDPGMIMPVVPALCTNCGYTLLINALIAADNN